MASNLGIAYVTAAAGTPVAPLEVEQKYFAKCIMNDGDNVTLVVRACSEVEASQKLHESYAIACVVELMTYDDMVPIWKSMKPSVLQRSTALF